MGNEPDEIGAQRAKMIQLGNELQAGMDPIFRRAGASYVLVVFTPEPPGFARFVSSVEESEVVRVLKELVVRMERGHTIDDPEEPEPT